MIYIRRRSSRNLPDVITAACHREKFKLLHGLQHCFIFQLCRLRSELETAKATLQNTSEAALTETDKAKLDKLYQDCREMRKLRNSEEAEERQLLQKTLMTWKCLKRLRQKQGYINTCLKLNLEEEKADCEQDEKEWKSDLQEELEEAENETSKGHQSLDTDAQEQNEANGTRYDSKFMWSEICSRALRTRRNPGESVFIPRLGSNTSITPIDQCPTLILYPHQQPLMGHFRMEKERRREISHQQVSLKMPIICLWLNVILSRTVTAHWNDVGTPIDGHVCGHRGLIDDLCTKNGKQASSQQFVNGTPVHFEIDEVASFIPVTSGILRCSTELSAEKLLPCKKQDNGSVQSLKVPTSLPTQNSTETGPTVSQNTDIGDFEIRGRGIDTDDQPDENAFILEAPECQLAPLEKFTSELRFRILESRADSIPEFAHLKMVPAFEKEIFSDKVTAML
ncbi:unnamed protein product [Soboliphyme baturini]|uniref:Uncharacterized protein n=1 Tax=Soboliphyme baturini TaxID=241478 RepID=A0A3P8BVB4_9BILA|nr:unnamed protein product [Soboliphyme baturini]